jgi:hypothetical protein
VSSEDLSVEIKRCALYVKGIVLMNKDVVPFERMIASVPMSLTEQGTIVVYNSSHSVDLQTVFSHGILEIKYLKPNRPVAIGM